MARELVDLSHRQLEKLAELTHRQEVEKLYEIEFESYGEQQEYLNNCTTAYVKTIKVLKDAQTMKDKAEEEKDATKMSIANDIFEYCTKAIGISLQFIRSYDSRLTFMGKLSDHTNDIIGLLNTLDPATQVEDAERLAKQALMYKDFMLDYAKKVEKFIPNTFTRWIKENGLTVDDLVARYMAELEFTGSFEELTDIQKLQVYERVIEAAGQGKSVVTYSKAALGTVGVALLVFTSATMVWDIATAENKLETAAKDAVNMLLGVVDVGEIASAAIAAGFEAAEIEVASGIITFMGTVVGFGVGAIIGIAANALLDLIFMTGSTKSINTASGLTVCRVAPMPNGLELARVVKNNYPDP